MVGNVPGGRVLVELLHCTYGRAAEQLYIAQSVLSRQVRALEHELGSVVFDRTIRDVRLTAAGAQLRLGGDRSARNRGGRSEASASGCARRSSLVVEFAPRLSVAAAVRSFESVDEREAEVMLLSVYWHVQAEPLRDGPGGWL